MESTDQITNFKVITGGPLEVKGNFSITGSDGMKIKSDETVYLCRCGGSGSKPFCDGTHKTNGFQS